jgi:hypothetical protein
MRPERGDMIDQRQMKSVLETELLLRELSAVMREQLARGADEEPGPLSINYEALNASRPRVIVGTAEECRPEAPAEDSAVPAHHLKVMRRLLSDSDVFYFKSRGMHDLASKKRRLNRRLYREFLSIYKRETYREAQILWSESARGDRDFGGLLRDSISLRLHIKRLELAPLAHLLRMTAARNIVERALRDIELIVHPKRAASI